MYFAEIRYIPTSLVSVDFNFSERIAVTLSGELSFGIDLAGDIANRISFGNVVADMSIEPSGSMVVLALGPSGSITIETVVTGTMNPAAYMSGLLISAQELSGLLTKVKELGSAPVGIAVNPSGSLSLTGGLVGSINTLLIAFGSLTLGQTANIPTSLINTYIDPTGTLRGTFRLQGNATVDTVLVGEMNRLVSITGTIDAAIDATGALSNNAYVADLASMTMIRPKTNREMIR